MRNNQEKRSWLSGQEANSEHHEPPKYLSRRFGATDEEVGQTKIILTAPEHAAFHEIARRLYGTREEDAATRGVIGKMSKAERQRYSAILENRKMVEVIKNEIIRRRSKYLE
jgi:hypothetical protein